MSIWTIIVAYEFNYYCKFVADSGFTQMVKYCTNLIS